MNMVDTQGNYSIAIPAILCIILLFSTIAYGGVDASALGVITVAVGIMSLIWIFRLVSEKQLPLNASILLVPIIVLIGIGLIQLLPIGAGDTSGVLQTASTRSLTLDPFSTRIFVVQLVIYLVFFAAALTFINSSKSKRVIALFAVGFAALMAFYGILQRLTNPDGIYGLRPTPQAIPFASFVNQHHFAALMEMAIGLGLGLLLSSKVRLDRTPMLIFALLIMTTAIVLTGSRGGMLSLVTVVLMVGIFSWYIDTKENDRHGEIRKEGTRSMLGIFAGVSIGVILALGLVLFLGGADSLLRGIGLASDDIDFTSGRSRFWKIAWKIFLSNPIIGTGFDSFGVAYTQYDSTNGFLRVEQAHNDYLQTLADGGVLAFAAVASFIYFLFRNGLRAITETGNRLDRGIAIGALAGCSGILTHSFFDFPLRTPANAFFFLILASLAVNTVSSEVTKRRKRV